MRKRRQQQDLAQEPLLFELPEKQADEIRVDQLRHPVWTENKAKLIERYLYYFVLVTKHGTYIDGFAGPQRPDEPEMWSAKLVLQSEPRWLRHFYLFDIEREKVAHLRTLVHAYPDRDIHLYQGDFNRSVSDLLHSGEMKQNEAIFCLLDQRTFECHWSTLQALAHY